jgi:hypothetical protein
MDHSLNAHVTLDIASDVVRIDVRGSLTQASRTSLLQTIQRMRHMGISSHIRVDLGKAGFVESSALAGLRNDLNTIDGGAAQPDVAGALPGPTGTGPLTVLSDDQLLAASDSVFGMLDNPADMASSELLATYDEIALELSRREDGRGPDPA